MAANNEASRRLSYSERASLTTNKLTGHLFRLMDDKKTNLCVALDLTTCEAILKLADEIGPYIAVLKTHADIIKDFTPQFINDLVKLSEKHRFLIFEDRKFADIGNTVTLQYSEGIHRISSWAHFVTVHSLPGPDIVTALKKGASQLNEELRGCLLLAEMSSRGNLLNKSYAQATVEIAQANSDFVSGFICQSQVSPDDKWVRMTPGVQLGSKGDQLGQQYVTPECAIIEKKADVIIVGRGVAGAPNPVEAAKLYREAGWSAYQTSISASSS